jgi:hypothetical protein
VVAGDAHRDALDRARAAAAAGDAPGMLKALAESRILDGLTRRLERDWKETLDHEDRHAVIAAAVDALYDAVRRGERVIFIGGFLYKVTLASADKRHRAKQREAATSPEEMDALRRDEAEQEAETEGDAPSAEWDESQRSEAVARLRRLVPRCGGPNIQNVLNIILDALERRIPHLGNTEIEAATGLTPGNVRKCRMRGLRRLERLAREAAVSAAALADVSIAADDDDEDEGGLDDDDDSG